jgi:predicted nucleic acid-binding protein
MIRQFRVLLDANVLVDAQVRDLFLRMAEADLIDVRWSRQILDETRRALTTKLHLTTAAADKVLGTLQAAFPTGAVEGFDHLVDKLALPDPHDRHVLAAAIHGECDLLVTSNARDFPDEAITAIREGDIAVVSVDDALREVVVLFRDRLISVVTVQVAALRNPPMTLDEFVARLCVRAPTGGPALGATLGLQRFAAIFAGIASAEGAEGPHEAVRLLVEALLDDDVESTRLLIDDDLARKVTGRPSPSPVETHAACKRMLGDVLTTDGWGFPTAPRPVGAGVELVKLLRVGSDPRFVSTPHWAWGHEFLVVVVGDGWRVVGIDEPAPAELDAPRSAKSA